MLRLLSAHLTWHEISAGGGLFALRWHLGRTNSPRSGRRPLFTLTTPMTSPKMCSFSFLGRSNGIEFWETKNMLKDAFLAKKWAMRQGSEIWYTSMMANRQATKCLSSKDIPSFRLRYGSLLLQTAKRWHSFKIVKPILMRSQLTLRFLSLWLSSFWTVPATSQRRKQISCSHWSILSLLLQ